MKDSNKHKRLLQYLNEDGFDPDSVFTKDYENNINHLLDDLKIIINNLEQYSTESPEYFSANLYILLSYILFIEQRQAPLFDTTRTQRSQDRKVQLRNIMNQFNATSHSLNYSP